MSTKTTKKATAKAQATQEQKEFNLERLLTLWIYKGKGAKYLSGVTEEGDKLTGFFNKEKKNPKEPDIKLYIRDDEGNISKDVYLSLWCNATDSGKKYLSGKFDNGDRVVGFFNAKAEVNGIIPYINVYLSDDENNQEKITEPKAEKKKAKKEEPDLKDIAEDDDLPY